MDASFFSIVFLICLLNQSAYAEMFTSHEQMTILVRTQEQLTNILKEIIDSQHNKLEEAKKMLKDYELITENAKDNPENFVGNPVNSFLLTKKLTTDFQNFQKMFRSSDIEEWVDRVKENLILPTIEDYEGVIVALHRLEDTYLLDPKDIRTGNLSRKHPSRPLNAFECFEFGRVAYNKKDNHNTIRWMKEALNQLEFEKGNATVSEVDILDYLSYASFEEGNLTEAIIYTEKLLELEPDNDRFNINLIYYQKKADDFNYVNKVNNHEQDIDESYKKERINYKALCRGDSTVEISAKRMSKLKCRYINYHPFLYIAPVKEEIVFDDPKMWLYHDVITDKQIETMKRLAFPKLKRAIVSNPITGLQETASYRISKSAWLKDEEDKCLTYLSSLLSAVTNLTMSSAEIWQIANYGIGGQYDPHFDHALDNDPDPFDQSIGNRIATWLYYLETPEVGGDTVFPSVGARVKATRRAAAFWYNLLPSGKGDIRTRHAACPVLFGTKWVSNRWIHEVGQEFRRPCNLHEEN